MLQFTIRGFYHAKTWFSTLFQMAEGIADTYETKIFWVFGILYKFSLDALYVWVASPIYAYGGLIYTPNAFKYLLSFVLYLLLFSYLPKKENSAPIFLLHLQFVFTLAPMLSVYGLVNRSTSYMMVVFLCAMLQIYIVRRPNDQSKTVHITGIKNYVTVALGVVVLFSAIVPVLYNGFDGLKAFNFAYVYEMRATATYPPGFEYFLGWSGKVILPFGILIFLQKKKYGWVGLCLLMQVLLFLETGHKITFFMLFPILFIYFCAKSGHLIKLMYGGCAALFLLIILCYRMDTLNHHPLGEMMGAVVAVRAILGPANNKFLFYDCFSQFPKIMFSDGQVGQMLGLTYPYKVGAGWMIYAFDGGEFMGSNSVTGYWGDSYAQMGFLGVLLMSLLFALLIRGLGSYDSRKNFPLLTGLFSVYIIILNDAALFTTLFSGGMLVAYLLVFIYLSSGSKGVNNGIQRL